MKPFELLANATRSLQTLFPGYFPDAKHDHYKDFGFPTTLTFKLHYDMYERNGMAKAAVVKTAQKVWEAAPVLVSDADPHDETDVEKSIRVQFDHLRVWQKLAAADRRAMVGGYSGVILRVGDDKKFSDPMEAVTGGIAALKGVIPAWAGQLTVSRWVTEPSDENYGQPAMFSFNEAALGDSDKASPRQFDVHPSRVVVWSEDGTVHSSSLLASGHNDLLTMEKIIGAGGEGFWKNAKAAPVLKLNEDIRLADLAASMGVAEDEVADAMNDQVEDYQKGFDAMLLLQGMDTAAINVTLPSPEHFYSVALQSFSASISMPSKILVGNQTGERASTEDAAEWAKTSMSRRNDQTIPNIMEFIRRLEAAGIIPEGEWSLKWADLTESSVSEKVDRAGKMAEINKKMEHTGEFVFSHDEIRDVVGLDPLSDAEKHIDDGTEL